MLLKSKPYLLLLFVSIIMYVFSFIWDKKETLDINIHDTYYILEFQNGFILLSLSFLITGLIYLIFDYFKIQLFYFLSYIHIYGSLVFIGLFFFYLNKINSAEDFQLFDSIDYNFQNYYFIITICFSSIHFSYKFNNINNQKTQ